ncbi:hypothetical protein SDC9_211727 [bioreactor metagenome]|uniref:Uncharacterized protein n=1 Tax=bioreactor metagenome TaxID=1076179 RepID=A0A645JJW1_9ZZZZ
MDGSCGAFEIRNGTIKGRSLEIRHEPVPERCGDHHKTTASFDDREVVSLEN